VVIDTETPRTGGLLLEAIRTITSQPITTVINSHTHPDHTGGRFVAHANTRIDM
jgi:glyoxylase-like metal-dependent hydrolase (beta-lactamase superfamily II)